MPSFLYSPFTTLGINKTYMFTYQRDDIAVSYQTISFGFHVLHVTLNSGGESQQQTRHNLPQQVKAKQEEEDSTCQQRRSNRLILLIQYNSSF